MRPEHAIDDWGAADRPYALGYTHLGGPGTVEPDKASGGTKP